MTAHLNLQGGRLTIVFEIQEPRVKLQFVATDDFLGGVVCCSQPVDTLGVVND